ncbi:hypothetical protein BDZ88DRAFT_455505 [Geranomyces variabilis]|nr:hypothetical protein BDZ88DRAFT_455505 [Geranomyces variabilis]KAJ3142452.1 hypothetical protein HDU90_004726 [Geranomyces variabilis]
MAHSSGLASFGFFLQQQIRLAITFDSKGTPRPRRLEHLARSRIFLTTAAMIESQSPLAIIFCQDPAGLARGTDSAPRKLRVFISAAMNRKSGHCRDHFLVQRSRARWMDHLGKFRHGKSNLGVLARLLSDKISITARNVFPAAIVQLEVQTAKRIVDLSYNDMDARGSGDGGDGGNEFGT